MRHDGVRRWQLAQWQFAILLRFRVIQKILVRPRPRQDPGDQGPRRWRRGWWLRGGLVVLVLDPAPRGATARRALHGAPRCTSGLVQAVLVVLLIARCEKKRGGEDFNEIRACSRIIFDAYAAAGKVEPRASSFATFFLWPAGSPGEKCV